MVRQITVNLLQEAMRLALLLALQACRSMYR